MEGREALARARAGAALVGLALCFLVILTQAGRLLVGWVAGLVQGGPMADWLPRLVNLPVLLAAFLVPYLFLVKNGKPLGLRISTGKGPVPVYILVPLFLGIMVAVNSVTSLLRGIAGAVAGVPAEAAGEYPAGFLGWLLYFITSCLAAPLLEELLFRGGIQGLLRPWGARLSIVLTSLVFTLMHAGLFELPAIFALSLLLGYVAQVSRSVWPGMVLHFANNLFVFITALVRQGAEDSASIALVFWAMLVFLSLFAGALWAMRAFHLWAKIKMPKEAHPLGRAGRRLLLLATTPVFMVGFVLCVAYFVVRLLAL